MSGHLDLPGDLRRDARGGPSTAVLIRLRCPAELRSVDRNREVSGTDFAGPGPRNRTWTRDNRLSSTVDRASAHDRPERARHAVAARRPSES